MALYLGKKKITPTKILREKQAPSNDAQLLLNDGTMYYYLTEYSIQQLMTGYYIIKE